MKIENLKPVEKVFRSRLTFLLAFCGVGLWEVGAFSQGVCIYISAHDSSRIKLCANVQNEAQCRNLGVDPQYIPNSTCAQVIKKNSSTSKVSMDRPLNQILQQVNEVGHAYVRIQMTGVDTFTTGNLQGSKIFYQGEGYAQIEKGPNGLLSVNANDIQIRLTDFQLGEAVSGLLREMAHEYFSTSGIANSLMQGTLKIKNNGSVELNMTQYRNIYVGGSEGFINSQARAKIPFSSNEFNYDARGGTYSQVLINQ